MDFKNLKEQALKLKKKVSEQTQKAVKYSANKLSDSNYTINKKEDLEKIIKKSATTIFKNKETWVEKQNKHKSIIIFAEEWSDFFKDALYILPVIATKAFTQNISVKLAKSKIEWVKLSDYKIKKLPSLVVFEEEKVLKTIEWREKILKLVKSFNLDINKLINEV
jgi:hypothetical protein